MSNRKKLPRKRPLPEGRLARTADIVASGVSPETLRKLLDSGALVRLASGGIVTAEAARELDRIAERQRLTREERAAAERRFMRRRDGAS